jgi:hypothetical protein
MADVRNHRRLKVAYLNFKAIPRSQKLAKFNLKKQINAALIKSIILKSNPIENSLELIDKS